VARRLLSVLAAVACLAAGRLALAQEAGGPAPEDPPVQQVTFDEAVRRALDQSPDIGQATQAILRAEGLLAEARTVFHPFVVGAFGTTVLDDARQFGDQVTQPRTQSAFSAAVSYPVLAASRWAAKSQAADQVRIATISAEETRRQVALTAAESYLAVLAAERQLDIARRNRDTAQALAEYARMRFSAGEGSRLNFVRASQEVATAEGRIELAALAVRRAQEALGVAIFADGPVAVSGDPELTVAAPPTDEEWVLRRPDVRLFTAELSAADRRVRDNWKSWLPTATASFAPQHVTPPGFFEPASTWRALFQLQVPLYDGTLRAEKRIRQADRETARLRLDQRKLQARSELRVAQQSVYRNERIVAASREAAANAEEALRITEIAYKAGASTNIEVIQAQQTARNSEIAAALAEDLLRQARLDLLVSLGLFPR
jgi:outer membrane protein TolC